MSVAPIVPPLGSHAVVIGGSVAGLLAARALADAYEAVTVIDRDVLPVGAEGRRGVPQGNHVHGLTVGGQLAMERLLPGLRDEMIEAGAPSFSANTDFQFSVSGHRFPRVALGETAILASRPFIESHLRRRVRALENVELRDRCEALELTADPGRGRVTGVRTRTGTEGALKRTLEADLVVAASGRSARVPAWLEELGYERPPESTLEIGLGYASRRYRFPSAAPHDRGVVIGPRPGMPRGVALFAQEDGGWLLTLGGFGSHRPPTDEAGFAAFLETVAPADLLAAIREGEPLGEIAHYGYSTERRRHYERMRRLPDRLLPIGDAICSFNPLYGQGMSVAALEAVELGHCLRRGARGLRRRYLRAAARIIAPAWQLAIGADLALPEVGGERPWSVRLGNAYSARLQEIATEDGEVSAALGRVTGMLERPSSLLRPGIVWRALGASRRPSPAWPGRPPRTVVRRRTFRVGGIATPLREAGAGDASEAVVFVHGVPGSGADFEPLLAAAGEVRRAIAWDAPGFGRADKPPAFDHSVAGHAGFLGSALATLGVERAHLVLHGFGGDWGLRWAAIEPQRVASVSLICAGVPFGRRRHRAARIWRAPLAGELAMAATTRAGFGASLRRAGPGRLPGPFVDRMFADFDRETRAAILRLHRSLPSLDGEARELAGALRPAGHPALVIWGERDPYLPASLAERQREAFADAETHLLAGSGHWPFVDRADRVEELLVGFLRRVHARPEEPAGAAQA